MSNLHRSNFQGHPFHLVSPSPWPLFTCISLLTLTTSGVLTMHGFSNSEYWLLCAFICLVSSMAFWFTDIISQGTLLGNHTLAVQKGLNMGVALFIVSEALFFLAIFWAYFHSALSPTVELGAQWPSFGIETVNSFLLPLINTVLFLAMLVSITYFLQSLIQCNISGVLLGAILTSIIIIISYKFNLPFTTFEFYFRTALAEDHPNNMEVWNLGQYLTDSKYEVLQERIRIGAPSNQVSLTDIGFRQGDPIHREKIILFERFIDKNPDLNAFKQYYSMGNNLSVIRRLSSVIITTELTDAMFKCKDMTI